ncbi:MAG: NAD(P)H-hydrate epimerase [Candidatus Omnitrophota bacterium]|nr:NAD(P)H-hydrate epimerase [Candidatus Omnitrophota bacterium]
MKNIISVSQAREIDNRMRENFGVPCLVLMENAGRSVAEEALKALRDKKRTGVVIVCGKGNNGADGLAACRHLMCRGIKPKIFLAAKISQVRGEARVNLDILLKMKQKVVEVNNKNLALVRRSILESGLIIDALLGIGIKREVRGIFRDLINIINVSKAYIIAVDVPSGLDADSGKALGCCVKADKTVTFVAKKQGMISGAGPEYCGRVIVRDLGVKI